MQRVARAGRVLLLTAAAIFVFASVAAAAKPTRTPVPASEDFVFEECGGVSFEIDFVQDKLTATTFTDPSGALVFEIVTGPFKVVVTNLETDESLRLNISGPGIFRVERDGTTTFTGVGPWIFFGFSPEEGFPSFFLAEGKFVFEDDTFTQVGRIVDLCAVLAG